MAFTRILGPGIHTASNINSHNIKSTGIITAVSFVGDGAGLTGIASTDNIITGTAATFNTYPVDINAGMTVAGVSSFSNAISGTTANFSGNVTVGGVLTYEDVKNVDSVGLGTFREGIFLPDNKEAKFGNTAASPDLKIYSDGTHSNIVNTNTSGYISVNTDNFRVQDDDGNDNIIRGFKGAKVELYWNGLKKFETTNTGATVTGTLKGASEVGIQSGGVQIGACLLYTSPSPRDS